MSSTIPARRVPAEGWLARAVSAEWAKLRSVRSTLWCLLGSLPLMVLWVGITGVALRAQLTAGREGVAAVPAHHLSAEGLIYLAQFAFVALAALSTAGEYATGTIRATLLWVPVRHRMVIAKGLALTPVFFTAGFLASLVGSAVAATAVGSAGLPTDWLAAIGSAAAAGTYLTAVAFITVAIAAAIRSVAGTLTAAFCLLTLLPLALAAGGGPAGWLPGTAGLDLMTGASPLLAVITMAAWTAAALAAAAALLKSRDA